MLSDVDMPGMMVWAHRGDPLGAVHRPAGGAAHRPGQRHDKARGVAVGADAYLVKDEFDQKALLETVAQLL